jgi:hypothetical protein
MELGYYDVNRAKSQAKAYLSKSIATLSGILGLDINTTDLNQPNPYQQGSHLYAAYTCLLNELKAYNKIIGE